MTKRLFPFLALGAAAAVPTIVALGETASPGTAALRAPHGSGAVHGEDLGSSWLAAGKESAPWSLQGAIGGVASRLSALAGDWGAEGASSPEGLGVGPRELGPLLAAGDGWSSSSSSSSDNVPASTASAAALMSEPSKLPASLLGAAPHGLLPPAAQLAAGAAEAQPSDVDFAADSAAAAAAAVAAAKDVQVFGPGAAQQQQQQQQQELEVQLGSLPATPEQERLQPEQAQQAARRQLQLHAKRLHRQPSVAALAQEHSADLAQLRQLAAAALPAAALAAELPAGALPTLPLRLDSDAELMRFARHAGLLRAGSSEAARTAALQAAAAAVAHSAAWLTHHTFSPEDELQQLRHLVACSTADAAGRPVLHVRIGQAVQECRGPAALRFANAVITHVELAVARLAAAEASSGSGSGGDSCEAPDTLVVVMDCRGGTALSATRIAWVFKAVAATLTHHYPGRLHQLVLLDLPPMLGWLVKGVKALLHPDSRHKLVTASSGSAGGGNSSSLGYAIVAASPSAE